MPDSVVALFCEDVRPELSGQHTLIGILPDNLEVPSVPGLMPKLGVYVRAVIEANHVPKQTAVRLTNTDGSSIPVAQWNPTIIQQGVNEASSRGLPVYGLISTAIVGPFRVPQAGLIQVTVDIDGTQYVAGVLSVMISASASQPQPAPAPTAAPPSSSTP
jgi:hypothetical protein